MMYYTIYTSLFQNARPTNRCIILTLVGGGGGGAVVRFQWNGSLVGLRWHFQLVCWSQGCLMSGHCLELRWLDTWRQERGLPPFIYLAGVRWKLGIV